MLRKNRKLECFCCSRGYIVWVRETKNSKIVSYVIK
jgi:hypothetical protein